MRSVICFRDLKCASLYFDHVLPVAFRQMMGTGSDIVTDFPEPIPSRALINIVFDKAADEGPTRYTDFGRIVDSWGEFSQDSHAYWPSASTSSSVADYGVLEEAYLRNHSLPGHPPLRRMFSEYAASVGIVGPDVLLPTNRNETAGSIDDPVVRLCMLPLIDTTRATWDQILEIRSDSEARVRLQRLRAFAETNYQSKTITYIEDDLSSRIEEYERASRKHGFDLVTGSLSTLLDSSNLQATAAATLAAAVLGGPVLAASAAACIELGKFTLEFAKRKRTMQDWASAHPLAYLIELQAATSEA